MSEQARPSIARNNYFTGESLLTADFVCEQQYNMEMLALLNGSLHTWGIASGLEVSWQANQGNQVRVAAGMAIDRLGRQIVLTAPQVVRVDGTGDNMFVYLVIRYHEVLGDLTDESGVPGYKRVVQQPLLACTATLQNPGIDIVLAVVNLTAQDAVNALTFKQGRYERRYVGSRLGVLALVTEGAGIDGGAEAAVTAVPGVRLSAKREDSGLDDYLSVEAARAQFDGMLATRGNVGVGVDLPQANLQVERIVTEGVGGITTKGRLLKFARAIHPPLRPGDLVIPSLPAGAATPDPPQAVIGSTTNDPAQFQMVQAFKEDLLVPARFSYVRATLASFSASGTVGELLNIGIDGSVGLGVRAGVQTGATGASALSITPDRRVGIALNGDTLPGATLDVNGDMRVSTLTCNGALTCSGPLKAQSFEGNGSKLQNLPILSYWLKQDVSSPYSSIYYDTGNVGVQMRDPPASLSVGTGQSFIGSGMVSVLAAAKEETKDDDGIAYVTITGTQTAFTNEVQVGDAIRLGELLKQYRQIRTVVADDQLELTEQFPTIVRTSAFKYLPAGSAGVPGAAQLVLAVASPPQDGKDGSGTISSSGTIVTGVGTKFLTELRVGDWIVIPEFRPSTLDGYQDQWLISEVKDDHTLVVIDPTGGGVPANVSAFLVAPALIAVMQSNSVPSDTPPPPAMLIANNRQDMSKPSQKMPNTVAINVPLPQIDASYALQVEGAVNFQGGGSFDKLTAQTITVTDWIKIAGAGDGGNVLAAGPVLGPLLTVTQSNVVIGAGKGSSLLEIGGDAHASGNLAAGAQLQGATAKVDGLTEAGALSVQGVQVGTDGTVALLGPRVGLSISASQPGCNGTASTDGLLVVQLSPNGDLFYGLVTVKTQLNGSQTSQNMVTASASEITTYNKDGSKDSVYYIPQNASLSVPVRKGEAWSMAFTTDNRVSAANVSAYWVPFGPQAGATSFAAAAVPAASAGQLLRQVQASPAASVPLSQSASQEEIDRRVAELTRSVGDALHLPVEGDTRQAFIERLQKLVCAATPPGMPPENRVDPKDIAGLIDFLAEATGRQFAPQERELFDKGVRALIAINDSDANRSDAALIRRNILMFMQYAPKALGLTLSQEQSREMIRALVRIVGTGMHDPFKGLSNEST
jgi:hypothetical protein